MVHKGVARIFRLLGAVLVLVLVAVPLLAWRLSQGPVALDFVTPYVVEALAPADGSYRVEIDGTMLAWGGLHQPPVVRAQGVRLRKADGGIIASVPELSINLSGQALLGGVVAPSAIALKGAQLRLIRSEDGRIELGFGSGVDEAASGGGGELLAQFLSAPDPSRPSGWLRSLRVDNARISLVDQQSGLSWRVPDADFRIDRNEAGITGALRGVAELAGESAAITLQGTYLRREQMLTSRLSFAGLRPATLVEFSESFGELAALDLAIEGQIDLAYDFGVGTLESVDFQLSGRDGILRLPDPLSHDYPVKLILAGGRIAGDLSRIELAELFVDFAGPVLTLGGVAAKVEDGAYQIKLDAGLRQVPVDQVDDLWPQAVAPNPRQWVTENLADGFVPEATATVSLLVDPANSEATVFEAVTGAIQARGVTVHYLRPMPPVLGVDADITFNADDFLILAKGGSVEGLTLSDGRIELLGLSAEDQSARIELQIDGPARAALGLIDSKPLGYASKLGVDPASVAGQSSTKLSLAFPLLADLNLDQLEVLAESSLADLSIPKVLMGRDLTKGKLSLRVDTKGMDVGGDVVLGGVPAVLDWRENFTNAEFNSRYRLRGYVDEAQRKSFGLDVIPFIAPWIEGVVAVDVTAISRNGGKMSIDSKIDLGPAEVALPGLGWLKPPGVAGSAVASVELQDQRLVSVPYFAVEAADLTVSGDLSFSGGQPDSLRLTRLKYGRTDAIGGIGFRDGGGLDIDLRGASFDASPFFGSDEDETAEGEEDEDLPPMTIVAELDQIWLGSVGNLTQVSGSLERNAWDWRSALIRGKAEGDDFFFALRDDPIGRQFEASSINAGAVLRAFDIYDNLIGGNLRVDGVIRDALLQQPIEGQASIDQFRVVNAPALAKVLNVASLTGIVDVLSGEGIAFERAEVPFTLTDGLLDLREARAYGAALGLTAKGQMDLDAGTVAIEGTVAPMYAFNGILGNIPLIGSLLTGEKGSGVFAATYSMDGRVADPSVAVNPLAALTPGFLRGFFQIFDTTPDELRPDGAAETPPPGG